MTLTNSKDIKINDKSFQDNNLLGTLSSNLRCQIIEILSLQKMNLNDISKKINKTVNALPEHLKKLQDYNLINKESDGRYGLTEYGKLIKIKKTSFDFITRHEKFFKEHTFGDIPPHLLNCIGMLSKSEFVDGAVVNFPKWISMVNESDSFFYGIITQPPFHLAEPLSEKLLTGIKVRLIFGKNSIVSNNSEFIKKLNLDRPIPQELIERRMAINVSVNVIITEKKSCLFFPNKKNITDIGKSFISDDKNFCDWCLDFFNFKWKNSEMFSSVGSKFSQN